MTLSKYFSNHPEIRWNQIAQFIEAGALCSHVRCRDFCFAFFWGKPDSLTAEVLFLFWGYDKLINVIYILHFIIRIQWSNFSLATPGMSTAFEYARKLKLQKNSEWSKPFVFSWSSQACRICHLIVKADNDSDMISLPKGRNGRLPTQLEDEAGGFWYVDLTNWRLNNPEEAISILSGNLMNKVFWEWLIIAL